MTSKKEGTNMGKKKKGYGKIAVLMLVLTLILAFTGLAMAEQEWLPGYGDKNGTLGKDGQSWRIGFINTLCMEGTTSDTSEACIRAVTLTADRFYNTPDASGTIALTESIGSTITLADTQLLVGQSTGLGAPKTMTGDGSITNGLVFSLEAGTDAQMLVYNAGDGWAPDTMTGDGSITNALVFSIEAGADAQIYVYNAGDGAGWDTMSGDMTLTNAAVASIAANAVGASELNRITNTLIIAAAATSNGIGNNVLYNSTYTLTPKSNANGNQFIANSTMDVNGNVTVFLNGTADVDYTVEVVRWAP